MHSTNQAKVIFECGGDMPPYRRKFGLNMASTRTVWTRWRRLKDGIL